MIPSGFKFYFLEITEKKVFFDTFFIYFIFVRCRSLINSKDNIKYITYLGITKSQAR
jgi:hypothetical protein